jgi:malate dehydrogenase (oxaloacetate-decarboxylating)(NADP+)
MSAIQIAGGTLTDQRVMVVGAGSAGIGIANSLLDGMRRAGMDVGEARRRFYILDKDGLLGKGRKGLPDAVQAYVRDDTDDALSFEETIARVKPTMLIGVSACAGAFTEAGVREMARHCERPIIFPLSNPTAKAECTAQQAYEWTAGRCVLASGSPFPPVVCATCRRCLCIHRPTLTLARLTPASSPPPPRTTMAEPCTRPSATTCSSSPVCAHMPACQRAGGYV